MNTTSYQKSGFSKFVLVLWIAIVFVLFFLLLPVFNTFKKKAIILTLVMREILHFISNLGIKK